MEFSIATNVLANDFFFTPIGNLHADSFFLSVSLFERHMATECATQFDEINFHSNRIIGASA